MWRFLLGMVLGSALSALGMLSFTPPFGFAPVLAAHRIDQWICTQRESCITAREVEWRRARISQSVEPLFPIPGFYEPAPTQARQEAAQAILECSAADFAAGQLLEITTSEGLAWQQGGGPEALIAAAEAGDADAQLDLALAYLDDLEDLTSEQKQLRAFYWLKRAADMGDTRAMAEVGQAYRTGDFGQDIHFADARAYLRPAAERGDATAIYNLVRLPPEDGRDLGAFATERLELELTAAQACSWPSAVAIANRLSFGPSGFFVDRDLSQTILDRVAAAKDYAD